VLVLAVENGFTSWCFGRASVAWLRFVRFLHVLLGVFSGAEHLAPQTEILLPFDPVPLWRVP